jgi:hypothetical protein
MNNPAENTEAEEIRIHSELLPLCFIRHDGISIGEYLLDTLSLIEEAMYESANPQNPNNPRGHLLRKAAMNAVLAITNDPAMLYRDGGQAVSKRGTFCPYDKGWVLVEYRNGKFLFYKDDHKEYGFVLEKRFEK